MADATTIDIFQQQPLVQGMQKSFAAAVLNGPQHTPPRTLKKAFSSVLQSNIDGDISLKTPTTHRGKPAVLFSDDDIDAMAVPFKHAIVGKFSRRSPDFKSIKPALAKLGFRGDFSVGALRPGFVLINFNLEEDFTRIWLKLEWQVNGWPMRVFKWSPNFNYNAESTLAAVWVSFQDLPVHFFNKRALFSIANLVGKPIKMDEPTTDRTRPSRARVCVEIDLTRSYGSEIWVGCGSQGGFWQKFSFENRSPYCQMCWKRGHEAGDCRLGLQENKDKEKELDNGKIDGKNLSKNLQQKRKEIALGKRKQVSEDEVLQKEHDKGKDSHSEQEKTRQRELVPIPPSQIPIDELHQQMSDSPRVNQIRDESQKEDEGDMRMSSQQKKISTEERFDMLDLQITKIGEKQSGNNRHLENNTPDEGRTIRRNYFQPLAMDAIGEEETRGLSIIPSVLDSTDHVLEQNENSQLEEPPHLNSRKKKTKSLSAEILQLERNIERQCATEEDSSKHPISDTEQDDSIESCSEANRPNGNSDPKSSKATNKRLTRRNAKLSSDSFSSGF